MPSTDDILWFKTQFQPQVEAAIAGTPLTVDFITALACQESGEVWPTLRRKGLPVTQVLALCVGDTLDANKGRQAFPQTKTDLLATPRGDEMFAIAHQALVDMAVHIPAYAGVAKMPNKFCHGFGMFQRDLQFFRTDPNYFLQRNYEHFDRTLSKCLEELMRALRKLGFHSRATLTDYELAVVGIVYNTGSFKPAKGLKQGYFDGTRFYGEGILDFMRLAHTVALPSASPLIPYAGSGHAIVAPPSQVTATGPALRVNTQESMLRVRREPRISDPPQANVIGHLPDGHAVRAVTDTPVDGFWEIEASLYGALLHGFASSKFLVPDASLATITPTIPASELPTSGIVPVWMPRKKGSVTRRSDVATAHSLNEPKLPVRRGGTPEQLRAELGAIIDWLMVDNPAHLRYQPHDGLTFCNIYAHDFCHLADVYLPRVWWSAKALLRLAKGESVAPLIGDTIVEMRANDLFRWLRDFGPEFGWRQTGTLSKLQLEVNQGAVGLIVARRKEDGRAGHIVVVVPETDDQSAKRNGAGEVAAPLQSQAGATNFRYGRGKAAWWNGEAFAESAFWLHA